MLSEDEASRVRNERQRIEERAARSLRPALATVLTPAQMDRAGLGGNDDDGRERSRPALIGHEPRRRGRGGSMK